MRRFMIVIIAFSLAAIPAALVAQTPDAQRRHGPAGAGMGGNIGERIIAQREALGLSLDQVARIRRIQTQLEEQNQPLVEQLRSQLQAQRPKITEEQRQQMRERRNEMRERRNEMRERRSEMRERAEQMTPEQRQQMRARMQQDRAGMREARPGRGALPSVRGPELPEETRALMQQVRENTQQAVRQIHDTLTAEQRAKLQELRPARRAPTRDGAAGRRSGGRSPGR